jgi:hypothetical protein
MIFPQLQYFQSTITIQTDILVADGRSAPWTTVATRQHAAEPSPTHRHCHHSSPLPPQSPLLPLQPPPPIHHGTPDLGRRHGNAHPSDSRIWAAWHQWWNHINGHVGWRWGMAVGRRMWHHRCVPGGDLVDPGIVKIRVIIVEPPTLDWAIAVELPTLDLTAVWNPGVDVIQLSRHSMMEP